MATDKHYNEPGGVPAALEDHKGTDMPATRWMFYIIAGALILFLGVLVVNHFRDDTEVTVPPSTVPQAQTD